MAIYLPDSASGEDPPRWLGSPRRTFQRFEPDQVGVLNFPLEPRELPHFCLRTIHVSNGYDCYPATHLQSTPREAQALSTSGPASFRNTFSFKREPLNRITL
jgi:hypothetical protein